MRMKREGFRPVDAIPLLVNRERLGISFLDLPTEIRLMIYRCCLMAPLKIIKPPSELQHYNKGWAMPTLDKSDREIDATVQRHRANHQSYVSLHQSYTGLRDADTGDPTLELSLLRLSKTIHDEAASVLYGENEFQFVLAITRRHPHVRAPKFYQPPFHDFRDNLTVVSEGYAKMIKKCTIEVRLPTFPWTGAKPVYLEYYARLAAFATGFGGDDHSLQNVAILFNRCFRKGHYFPLSCLRTSQNVLETLAAIHGVRHSVTVGGVMPAFEAKLSLAMMSRAIAYVPKEEKYGQRMVMYKGKRRLQRYKLGRYYDSNNVWSRSVLGPYQPHSKEASPAYGCCEVCDERPPLTFPHLWRRP
ncbi:hypothetical protein HO173_002776 [Letharia columbiana]|uniref:Uncharacterized protein n=1 Tax=Letharia columbiana TaxID=112416 RepID=A0A8H6L803_9LECA|nr:uncharacterized protein HO173_002776 [Letharia columbiana]KAF6238904.1 hypothetical protein HO173_002776 [Letharia columbiana]